LKLNKSKEHDFKRPQLYQGYDITQLLLWALHR